MRTTELKSTSKELKDIAQQTKLIHSAFLALLNESREKGDYDHVKNECNIEFYDTYLKEIIKEKDSANLTIKTATELMNETKSARRSWLCLLRLRRPWMKSRHEEAQTAHLLDSASSNVTADSEVTDYILKSLKENIEANPILA